MLRDDNRNAFLRMPICSEAPVTIERFVLGLLVIWFFIEWGERRLLEARFESYARVAQLTEARRECTAQFLKEHYTNIDENKWTFRQIRWGTAPANWPFHYFKFGEFWNSYNASFTMVLSYEIGSDSRHICDYGIRGKPQIWKSNAS
jgi:hypothetical protein